MRTRQASQAGAWAAPGQARHCSTLTWRISFRHTGRAAAMCAAGSPFYACYDPRRPGSYPCMRSPMRLHHATVLVLLIAPAVVIAQENLGTYEDRMAVEDVMARYVWAVDSLDADGYVAVFTEDAVIDSNGSIMKGHAEIRTVVTGLIQRQNENKAKGLPVGKLYHVISSPRITFPKPGEALYQSYWQTMRKDKDG